MGKEVRRKGIDRRQQKIEVSVDRRSSTERRVMKRRSGFYRRIQVSEDRSMHDRRRGWV